MPKLAHNLLYGFVPRTLNGVKRQFDPHTTWISYRNRKSSEAASREFRLDVHLDEDAPSIDDTEAMKPLQDLVRSQPGSFGLRIELAITLLTTSFFFELCGLPVYSRGVYRCSGYIYCRNSAPEVVQRLLDLCGPYLEFQLSKATTKDAYLSQIQVLEDVCAQCTRFKKEISFTVDNLEELITINLKTDTQPLRPIAGFPQTPRWFIKQQRLTLASGVEMPGRTCCTVVRSKRVGDVVENLPKRQKREQVEDETGQEWI